MNPFLPFEFCIPDCEGRVFNDRVYIYGSTDKLNNMDWCSQKLFTFSASADNLSVWKAEGEILNIKDITWSEGNIYAPDCIEKDNKYYIYFPLSDNSEGVGVGESPKGPFKDIERVRLSKSKKFIEGIDPSVFVDDDGKAYYFYGQKNLKGGLLKNYFEIDEDTHRAGILTEKEHFFHEGASMRKIKGRYYLLFCSISGGKATRLDYAIGDSPLGKFKYMGTVIDNISCDENSWNNHGSICEIKGEYYVFYHRASNNSQFSRRACCEKIEIKENGEIEKTEMTSSGFGGYLKENEKIPFITGVERKGKCYFTYENNKFICKNIQNEDYLAFKYFNIEKIRNTIKINLEAKEDFILEIYGNGKKIKTVEFKKQNGFIEHSINVNVDKNIKSIGFRFKGEENKELLKAEYFIME